MWLSTSLVACYQKIISPWLDSMPITVTCDECNSSIRVRESAVGKRFQCKECGQVLVVKRGKRDIRKRRTKSSGLDDDWDDYEPAPKRNRRRNRSANASRSRPRAGLPKRVKGAMSGLIVLGVFWLTVGVFGFESEEDKGPVVICVIFALMGIGSALMIWKRIPGGQTCCNPFRLTPVRRFSNRHCDCVENRGRRSL